VNPQVNDREVLTFLDAIANHYRNNLNNRYLRQAMVVMSLDNVTWSLIESVTEKGDYYTYQGYHFDELYERVLALARFVYHARREVEPQLRTILGRVGTPGSHRSTGSDRVLREMAVNNFASNLSILSDLIDKLYQRIVTLDTESHKNDVPVYKRMRALNELGRFLVPR
jgi:hypothetical protein